MKEEDIREQEVIEATRLIGKNIKYIKKIPGIKQEMINALLKTMMVKPGNSKKNEKGRVIATTRTRHYANTAFIALKIAKGLKPNDNDFARGVALAALWHDLGQWPFGHDGDEAAKYSSQQNNGGPRLHNIEGMDKFRFRVAKDVIEVINSGRIVEEESQKRGISEEELKRRIDMGIEPEIVEKIQKEVEKNGDLPKIATEVIAMAIGNHNGERGVAHIIPDYTRTFEEVCETAQKTYFDPKEEKNMISCNIVDAIVKISDQISSIPFDIIDAKRAGIETEIFEGWSEPIAKILRITEQEAIDKLKGDDKELEKLAVSLQNELIESVIRSSDIREINMDLEPLLYGVVNEKGEMVAPGLRTYNMPEHIAYTSSAEMEVALNNIISELTDILSSKLLEENATFYPKLNEIFRISANNPLRKVKERILFQEFNDDERLEDFYRYIIETTSEEYYYNKNIVKKGEVQYFRNMIEKSLLKRKNIIEGVEKRSPRNSTVYLIEEYMLSPNYEAIEPDENNNYSDAEVKKMLDRINIFLKAKPIEGIEHLSLLVPKHKYIMGVEGEAEKISTGKRKINTDQQIAARLAIGYINTLNDQQLIQLASKLGIIDQKVKRIFEEPYVKKTEKNPYHTKANEIAKKLYRKALDGNKSEDVTK